MDLNNKPNFTFVEFIKCLALIAAGCLILSFMPDEMRILGWIMFAIGTFLSIVGIFRLAAMVPELNSEPERKIVKIISLAAAVFIQIIGLLYLYNSSGSGKAMAITTLTLCISLGLIIYVIDFEDKKMKKKMIVPCRIITVLLVAIAVFITVKDDFSNVSIYVGTILLIEAVVTGRIGFSKKHRNRF